MLTFLAKCQNLLEAYIYFITDEFHKGPTIRMSLAAHFTSAFTVMFVIINTAMCHVPKAFDFPHSRKRNMKTYSALLGGVRFDRGPFVFGKREKGYANSASFPQIILC